MSAYLTLHNQQGTTMVYDKFMRCMITNSPILTRPHTPYRVMRRVCRTGASPFSARLDLLLINPTILSLSLQEDNSGFVTITASSARYMACRAPVGRSTSTAWSTIAFEGKIVKIRVAQKQVRFVEIGALTLRVLTWFAFYGDALPASESCGN